MLVLLVFGSNNSIFLWYYVACLRSTVQFLQCKLLICNEKKCNSIWDSYFNASRTVLLYLLLWCLLRVGSSWAICCVNAGRFLLSFTSCLVSASQWSLTWWLSDMMWDDVNNRYYYIKTLLCRNVDYDAFDPFNQKFEGPFAPKVWSDYRWREHSKHTQLTISCDAFRHFFSDSSGNLLMNNKMMWVGFALAAAGYFKELTSTFKTISYS